MYNCHIHTFTMQDIPEEFLPAHLVKIMKNKVGYFIVKNILRNIIPFTSKDAIEKYANFIEIGESATQEYIFKQCYQYYPANTFFIVLAMDLEFMNAGNVSRPYINQINELGELSQKYTNVIPFIHIDPRRKGFMSYLRRAHEFYGFKGIKLYPNVGYLPFDKRLYEAYDYCSQNNMQVTTHCSPYNPVHYRGEPEDIRILLKESKVYIPSSYKLTTQDLCSYFTHPLQYEQLLNDFPNVNFDLAHFGSKYYIDKYNNDDWDDNWFLILLGMLSRYKNLYTDISYTLSDTRYFRILDDILKSPKYNNKILYGSDFYMISSQKAEKIYYEDLVNHLDPKIFNKIAVENPKRFLKI